MKPLKTDVIELQASPEILPVFIRLPRSRQIPGEPVIARTWQLQRVKLF